MYRLIPDHWQSLTFIFIVKSLARDFNYAFNNFILSLTHVVIPDHWQSLSSWFSIREIQNKKKECVVGEIAKCLFNNKFLLIDRNIKVIKETG